MLYQNFIINCPKGSYQGNLDKQLENSPDEDDILLQNRSLYFVKHQISKILLLCNIDFF